MKIFPVVWNILRVLEKIFLYYFGLISLCLAADMSRNNTFITTNLQNFCFVEISQYWFFWSKLERTF